MTVLGTAMNYYWFYKIFVGVAKGLGSIKKSKKKAR